MKKKQRFLFISLFLWMSLLSACGTETLEKKQETVEGNGVSYQFYLPKGWKKQENFHELYGRQAVLGAEDTRSNSSMFLLVFPKDSVKIKEFGQQTREELAKRNGYKKVEDVYMKEYKVNGAPAYKYTFETKFNGKKMWAHFYCIFSKNGVAQWMFYSADDANYEKRVEWIDAAIDTVKETGFDQTKASSLKSEEKSDEIKLSHPQFSVTVTGIAKVSGEAQKQLLVIRYDYTNQSQEPEKSQDWRTFMRVTQGDQELQEATLPLDSNDYQIKELVGNSDQEIQPGEMIQGALLYELTGTGAVNIDFLKEIESAQSSYTLIIPTTE